MLGGQALVVLDDTVEVVAADAHACENQVYEQLQQAQNLH